MGLVDSVKPANMEVVEKSFCSGLSCGTSEAV